jgi:diguanylate cyclase (GGDEF)-like protein
VDTLNDVTSQLVSKEISQDVLKAPFGSWLLSFPDQLEKTYQAEALRRSIKMSRLNGSLTAFLYAAMGYAAYTQLPPSSHGMWLAIYCGVALLMIAARIIIFFGIIDRWFNGYIALNSISIIGLSIFINNALPVGNATALSYLGMSYIGFFIYCFVGLRFPYALLSGWLGGFFGITLVYAVDGHINWQMYIIASAIGVVVAYGFDRYSRINFLQAHSLAVVNQELTYLSLHDGLTKLPNRALLEDRFNQALAIASREASGFTLMFMDLDGFKQVNDAYGHHTGDLLLLAVAQRLQNHIRAQDTIARIGGDEFVLLMKTTSPEDVATLADKLLNILRMPFQIENHTLLITGSIGITLYPDNGKNQHDLLTNADAAMYHAKAMGRNSYCFFEASMNTHAHEQMEMIQDLRLALKRGEMIVYYQLKVDAQNGTAVGAEALIRWQHPTRGLVSPDQFIPLAEKTGLIIDIGAWVLDEACQQMRQWLDLGHHQLTIAVNLSALQFAHAELTQMVSRTLARHALEPRYLTLEVTESTAMYNVDASTVILQRLHDMGIQIAIDDFGTGYSSLLYLKRLPASELKIDRGFVCNLEHDTEDIAIVTAIVALSKSLGLKTVAEGVETVAQQKFLRHLGCDSLQGYLFGKPMPSELFIDALSHRHWLK